MACCSRGLGPGSDRQGQFVERDGQPPARWLFDCQLIVFAPNILNEGMARDDHPGLRSCLSPRIGRSRAFSRL